MMSTRQFSDEEINAFVDGEADAEQRERIFLASATDATLQRRIAQAERLKAMLRHAYAAPPLAEKKRAGRSLRRHAAAAALLLTGLGTGWLASSWHDQRADKSAAGVASLSSTVPAQLPGVVIQVADADPEKWKLALDQATEVAEHSEARTFDVVVIAYGPGLGMLRGVSPVGTAIERAQKKGIRFIACGNTMQTERIRAAQLLPGVQVASAGATLEIVALQKAGYAYVRI